MNKTGYPVKWEGKTLFLSDLTVGVKDDFCSAVMDRMVVNIRRRLPFNKWSSAEKTVYIDPPEWTTQATPEVAKASGEDWGKIKLVRLLLGADDDEMDDAEIERLGKTKMKDPTSDYAVAMNRIWGNSDPKAEKGETGLPPPTKTDTGTSESSPSSATTPLG